MFSVSLHDPHTESFQKGGDESRAGRGGWNRQSDNLWIRERRRQKELKFQTVCCWNKVRNESFCFISTQTLPSIVTVGVYVSKIQGCSLCCGQVCRNQSVSSICRPVMRERSVQPWGYCCAFWRVNTWRAALHRGGGTCLCQTGRMYRLCFYEAFRQMASFNQSYNRYVSLWCFIQPWCSSHRGKLLVPGPCGSVFLF